jgi:hypothetical protein
MCAPAQWMGIVGLASLSVLVFYHMLLYEASSVCSHADLKTSEEMGVLFLAGEKKIILQADRDEKGGFLKAENEGEPTRGFSWPERWRCREQRGRRAHLERQT